MGSNKMSNRDNKPDIFDLQGEITNEELEGSGATGGALTGEGTTSGMSEDLTSGVAGAGWFGGPTGGDFEGGGAGSGRASPPRGFEEVESQGATAKGQDVSNPEERMRHSSGLAQKVAAQNTKQLLEGEYQHEGR